MATGSGKRNPGTFLKGLCGGYLALTRADRCPAKGQPLQESFGVFLWYRPYSTRQQGPTSAAWKKRVAGMRKLGCKSRTIRRAG